MDERCENGTCDCNNLQKKRVPWFTMFLILVVVVCVAYSVISGKVDPLSFPGAFGY
ncbi:hypothetical protein KGQ34_01355 [Patescibacteria group bacterium]|nr:hypothetical protein [Patescibacteria group bacterium]